MDSAPTNATIMERGRETKMGFILTTSNNVFLTGSKVNL